MVGLDARAAFVDPHRGFGRVAAAATQALLEAMPGQCVVFVPHGAPVPDSWYPLAARVVQLRRPRRGALLADPLAWRWTVPRHALRVLYLPAWGVPPAVPCATVATFHDATPFRFPSPPSWWRRLRLRAGIRSLRRATLVQAGSFHAARELTDWAPVDPQRVRVVHWGVGAPFRPAVAPAPPQHLLFVGGDEPHKNLRLLVDALAPEPPLPLVVVAPPAAREGTLRLLGPLAAAGHARVRWGVDDEELVSLYQTALATLVPSRNEGFGLPAVEAMACACPVIAAAAGALPEVCGSAAILLPPQDARAWREAVVALARDPARRAALAEAGRERAAAFSWARCARELGELYREATRLASA